MVVWLGGLGCFGGARPCPASDVWYSVTQWGQHRNKKMKKKHKQRGWVPPECECDAKHRDVLINIKHRPPPPPPHHKIRRT